MGFREKLGEMLPGKKRDRKNYNQGAKDISDALSSKLDMNAKQMDKLEKKFEENMEHQLDFNESVISGLEEHENRLLKNEKKIKHTAVICIFICILAFACMFLFIGGNKEAKNDSIKDTPSQKIEEEKENSNVSNNLDEKEDLDQEVADEKEDKYLTEDSNNNDDIREGSLLDNLSWKLIEKRNPKDSTLVISGEGRLFTDGSFSLAQTIEIFGEYGKVIIEEGITEIGDSVFSNDYFIGIDIASSVTSIGNGAFGSSNIENIKIPYNVSYIGHGAFAHCSNLTEVIIYNPNIEIENYAFDGCPNVVLYGPKGSNIETYAFNNNYAFKAL